MLFALLTACGWFAAPKPNVLVVTLDTTRADHLQSYGYFRQTMPNVAGLAEQGIVFEDCLAPTHTTLPSHLTLFTGTAPTEHGVVRNMRHGGVVYKPSDNLRPLASLYKDNGYATGGFVSAAPLRSWTNISTGFDTYDQPSRDEGQRRGQLTVDAATSWLETQAGPWFAWVHLYDPHTPHRAPESYQRFTDSPALRGWLRERKFARVSKLGNIKVRPIDTANSYDAELSYADDQVGRLLALAGEDAIVIVVGDHGEGLNQHGEAGHGHEQHLWLEQLRVPCILRIPGEKPRRVPTLMGVADIVPTLLARPSVNLKGEEELLAQVSGRDVLAKGLEERPVFARTGKGQRMALITEKWSFYRTADGDELYHRVSDPHELDNLVGRRPKVERVLGNQLEERYAAMEARALEIGPPLEVNLGKGKADHIDQLRELGYVE